MQSRNMKHFFDEDFFESWYNVISKDLDSSIIKSISHIEDSMPLLQEKTVDGTGLVTGSVLLFGDAEEQHIRLYATFMDEILNCTLNEVRNYSQGMLDEFKEAMHDFQSAYQNLFRKELPEYLENFEFGTKFRKFAQVNVFLHKMNVEHWIQEPTYSIWSLMCDIGGALGLFLGASLLTLIEVAYFVFHTKIYKNLRFWRKDNKASIDGHSRVRINPKQKWSRVIEVSNGGSFKFPRRKRLPSFEQWRISPSPTSSSASFQSLEGDSNPIFDDYPSLSHNQTPKQLKKTESDGKEFPPRRKFGSWDAEVSCNAQKSALRNKNTASSSPGEEKQKEDLNRRPRSTAVSPESAHPSLDRAQEKSSSKEENELLLEVMEESSKSSTSSSTNDAKAPLLFSAPSARKSTSSEDERKKKKKKVTEKQSIV
uniref:Uncharacterized protein n=1 Tax=Ditylenchus dipsaci TaxID=166011 RepID=A0A915EPB1_9BILA